jgi:hypothetical protein
MIEHIKIRKRAWILRDVIKKGNTENLDEFLKNYRDIAVLEGLMQTAAEYNNIEALKICLKTGLSPDCYDRNSISFKLPPLWYAIMYGSVKTAEFLLDAGADLHLFNDSNKSSYLISAAMKGKLPMVKMLLKRGVDIHAEYSLGGTIRFNALTLAVKRGHYKVAEYLRSQGAVWFEDEKSFVLSPVEEQMKNLSQYFGDNPHTFNAMQIVSVSAPLMVHIFHPKRDTTVFVTSGLIEYALVVPKTKEEYQFAEYFIEIHGQRFTTDKALDNEENFWPISWLKAISRYPHENKTYYGEKKIVTSKMIPSLITPDRRYKSAKVERVPEFNMVISQDGRLVIYYRITPIE